MKDLVQYTPVWYKIALCFCALLITVSFFLPPRGTIDPSVLCAVGELGGMAFLGMMPRVIHACKKNHENEE